MQDTLYDLVICGGGLAGLTLAIQLKQRNPTLSICLLERQAGPLPTAAHKVGESTVVIGAYYLEQVLGLKSYLEHAQLEKLGLRFYFSEDQYRPFYTRPELGRSDYQAIAAEWQLDRGTLETDLRRIVLELGVELLDDVSVKDIVLGQDQQPHQVDYQQHSIQQSLRCRWVVDAMGRRRFLQRKLSLQRPSPRNSHSSAWFRVQGRIDFAQHVPTQAQAWHQRVNGQHPEDAEYGRNHSTTHFVGEGYWVWVIPLASGNTSIGIVTEESIHPFTSYQDLATAQHWLQQHEPDVQRMLADLPVLDFAYRRNFSYSCQQMISATQRWALSGEAGVFIDPLYSPGTDAIGYSNSIITDAICRDLAGQRLAEEHVQLISQDFIHWSERSLLNICDTYDLLASPGAACLKVIWDLNSSVWLNGLKFRNAIFTQDTQQHLLHYLQLMAEQRESLQRLERLKGQMLQILQAWSKHNSSYAHWEWLDYFADLPFLFNDLCRVAAGCTDIGQELAVGLKHLEDLALALSLLALKDLNPSYAKQLQQQISQQGLYLSQLCPDPSAAMVTKEDAEKLNPRDLHHILQPLEQALFNRARLDTNTEPQPLRAYR